MARTVPGLMPEPIPTDPTATDPAVAPLSDVGHDATPEQAPAPDIAAAVEPTPVFIVTHDRVGDLARGDRVTAAALGGDALLPRLLELGAIAPVELAVVEA